MRIYALLVLVLLGGCDFGPPSDDHIFTLYRTSPLDATMRIHIASFDASDGEKYNRENCEIASQLFKEQPGVTIRYFCEKGRYRK